MISSTPNPFAFNSNFTGEPCALSCDFCWLFEPADLVWFIVDFDELGVSTLTDIRIGICTTNCQILVSTIGSITTLAVDPQGRRFAFVQCSLPVLAEGFYRMCFHIDSGGNRLVVACSGCIYMAQEHCHTVQMLFVNENNSFDIPYASKPPDFAWRFRLPALINRPQIAGETRINFTSNGTVRKLASRLSYKQELETGYLPDAVHEIVSIGLEHETLQFKREQDADYIDYVSEGNYNIEWNNTHPLLNLAKGNAVLSLQTYKKISSYCN